jgi:hypothetical protein
VSINVWGQRNTIDVVITPITRIPGSGSFHPDKEQKFMECSATLFACDRCGVVPVSDDDQRILQLKMVSAPDRKGPIFLGPACTEAEVTRYLSRMSVV